MIVLEMMHIGDLREYLHSLKQTWVCYLLQKLGGGYLSFYIATTT